MRYLGVRTNSGRLSIFTAIRFAWWLAAVHSAATKRDRLGRAKGVTIAAPLRGGGYGADRRLFVAGKHILAAVAWFLFNYRNGTLYPMSAVSAQAGVMVLLGIALYALTGVPPS